MPQRHFEFDETIDDQFEDWLKENRRIVGFIKNKALAMRRSGRTHYGMKAIVEAVRYDTDLREKDSEWKINNNYTSRLSRLLMRECPELEGFFQVRELKS